MSDSEIIAAELLREASDDNPSALGELLQMYRERLLRVIAFRMDSRLRGRFDPTDVLQDAFVEATTRFSDYVENQEMPFFLWLRFLAVQKLFQLHRRHLGVQGRDAAREVSLYAGPLPQATSAILAAQLLGKGTSPSMAAVRSEQQVQVERTLNEMREIDREVLVLRHFEQLTNSEVARLLEISDTAANNRYMRALRALKRHMDSIQRDGNSGIYKR